MEDSQQGFGVGVTVAPIVKLMLPLEEQLGQQTLRKPVFNSASTIGGLAPRKRDDKLKFTSWSYRYLFWVYGLITERRIWLNSAGMV